MLKSIVFRRGNKFSFTRKQLETSFENRIINYWTDYIQILEQEESSTQEAHLKIQTRLCKITLNFTMKNYKKTSTI
jgi:hypothetical protein